MKLIIELDKIKKLAEKKSEENKGFRSFLKTCEIPQSRVDMIVHRLYKNIYPKIDCTACFNCCKEVGPVISPDDIDTLSKELRLSKNEFISQYLVKMEEPGLYTFNQKPCPLLKDNLCSVYEVRPGDCRSYPHLLVKKIHSHLCSIIKNCAVCPIVYNVFEVLKIEIWGMMDDYSE